MIGPLNEIEVTIEEQGVPPVRLYFYAASRRDLLVQLRVHLSFYKRIVVGSHWLADNQVAAVIENETLNQPAPEGENVAHACVY